MFFNKVFYYTLFFLCKFISYYMKISCIRDASNFFVYLQIGCLSFAFVRTTLFKA